MRTRQGGIPLRAVFVLIFTLGFSSGVLAAAPFSPMFGDYRIRGCVALGSSMINFCKYNALAIVANSAEADSSRLTFSTTGTGDGLSFGVKETNAPGSGRYLESHSATTDLQASLISEDAASQTASEISMRRSAHGEVSLTMRSQSLNGGANYSYQIFLTPLPGKD